VTPSYDPEADDMIPPPTAEYRLPPDPAPPAGHSTWDRVRADDSRWSRPGEDDNNWDDPGMGDSAAWDGNQWQPLPPTGERRRRRQALTEGTRDRRVSRMADVGDDYVMLPPKRRGLPRVAIAMVFLLVVLAVAGFVGRSWYQNQIDPSGRPGASVDVEVVKGTSLNGLGKQLADKGVISNATLFHLWVRSKHVDVQTGSYVFRQRSSFEEALATVRKGPLPPRVTQVTLPEGLTLAAIEAKMHKTLPRFGVADIHAALTSGEISSPFAPKGSKNLEGLVFPSTYDLGVDDNAEDLVQRMVEQMGIVMQENGADSGVQGTGVPTLTSYQILVVASLVQAEAGNVAEAPKIARVIYNRLAADQPLGIDATSRYLAQKNGTKIDFDSPSAYNTRRRPGLPPTPIDAPGEFAIKAALHPASGPWLYYVLAKPRQHAFTDDYDEFVNLKKACVQQGLGCG
jgi:UPF0755 protein